MDRIALAVEPSLGYRHEIPDASDEPTIGQAMSNAACDIAEALGAKRDPRAHVHGRTASAVARLVRGADRRAHPRPVLAQPDGDRVGSDAGADSGGGQRRRSVEHSVEAARASGIVEPGDRIVLTAGTAVNIPGSTNVIKVDIA